MLYMSCEGCAHARTHTPAHMHTWALAQKRAHVPAHRNPHASWSGSEAMCSQALLVHINRIQAQICRASFVICQ